MTNNPYPEYSYSPDPDAGDSPYSGAVPAAGGAGDGAADPYGGQEPWAAPPGQMPGSAPGHSYDAASAAAGGPADGARPPRRSRMRRWATPVMVGVLAFVVGVAAGAGGEEEAGPQVDLDAEIAAAVAEVEQERDALAAELEELESASGGWSSDLEEVTAERDELAGEIEDARAERDEAVERAQALETEREEEQAAADAEAEAAAEAAEATSFGNGTWRVGEDIDPGTYRTDGASGCYWERLSGFSGEFGDIISNDFTSGPTTVTIQASDAGFSSQGCGTWEWME